MMVNNKLGSVSHAKTQLSLLREEKITLVKRLWAAKQSAGLVGEKGNTDVTLYLEDK